MHSFCDQLQYLCPDAAGCLVQIPVLVSDLDLECKMWLKIRLAPMCPYFGTISLAFVGPPTIKVQLLPYNRVRLMRIPILQVCPLCPSLTCIGTDMCHDSCCV